MFTRFLSQFCSAFLRLFSFTLCTFLCGDAVTFCLFGFGFQLCLAARGLFSLDLCFLLGFTPCCFCSFTLQLLFVVAARLLFGIFAKTLKLGGLIFMLLRYDYRRFQFLHRGILRNACFGCEFLP